MDTARVNRSRKPRTQQGPPERVPVSSQRLPARYLVLWRDTNWSHGGYFVCWDHYKDEPRRFTTRREAESWAKLSYAPIKRPGALVETKRTKAVVRHESRWKKFLKTQSLVYLGDLQHDRCYPVGD